MHAETASGFCPLCGAGPPDVYDFRNSEEFLKREVEMICEERRELGLQGLVGGLEYVTVNTEPDMLAAAVNEVLRYTGHDFSSALRDEHRDAAVLTSPGSADILLSSRKSPYNPFSSFNEYPKTRLLPNTRLETFVFSCDRLERYVEIQKERGIRFMTDEPVETDSYLFIQSPPSRYTGDSYGFVKWKKEGRQHLHGGARTFEPEVAKPDMPHLGNIGRLDHTATRVRAHDRDAAILEFLEYTSYDFRFAVYVKIFNSITNVARLGEDDFAMVFTSGISPYVSDRASGPTEKYIRNFGPRVHHMAFDTVSIEETYDSLRGDGMRFLIGLVGGEDDGLKQTFSNTSPTTFLVNEYIHRYGDFDGFFTKSNVTDLTGATDRQ